MMTLEDYANDVSKSLEEVMALCDKVGIQYDDGNTLLDDISITLLDNEIQDSEDYVEGDIEDLEEQRLEEEVTDKAEELAYDTKIDLDETSSFTKVKPKKSMKTENTNTVPNKDFLKERKKIYKHREKLQSNDTPQDENVVLYKQGMTVTDLANELGAKPVDLVKKLMGLGVMAGINQSVDYDSAEVIASEYDKTLKREETQDISNFENYEIEDKAEDLVERPPVVTVMGHVDHGKTSLLDKIRQTDVVSGEAGGITQAIGAYSVTCNGKKITFIDTPGHAAFTEMRARGASITDIVIIIVAADDGIMPQTIEAIDHAKAAGVPIIVAINKIDKPEANIDRIMTALVENGLTPEEWGGNIIVNKISAKTGVGIDELLENILLVAEMQEYKANPNRYATGAVVESRKDSKVGSIATLLIQIGRASCRERV